MNTDFSNKKKRKGRKVISKYSIIFIFEPCSVKRGLNLYATSIDHHHTAQSVQADMGQNFLLSLNFLCVNG